MSSHRGARFSIRRWTGAIGREDGKVVGVFTSSATRYGGSKTTLPRSILTYRITAVGLPYSFQDEQIAVTATGSISKRRSDPGDLSICMYPT